jgi:hypothetical protein
MAQILKHPCHLPRAGTSIPKPGGDKFMMRRRDFLVSAAAACLGPGLAGAQGAWPQRPISLVVPFSAGGSADLVARMFAQHFQAKYGVSVVIENKGGAGGSIGSALVAKAPPDGYTLVLGTVSTHAINPALYAKLPFNVETSSRFRRSSGCPISSSSTTSFPSTPSPSWSHI